MGLSGEECGLEWGGASHGLKFNIQHCSCVCVCVFLLHRTQQYGSSSVTLLAKSIAVLPVEVASVTTVPEDSRIYIRNNWGKLPRLKPNTLNEVRCCGWIDGDIWRTIHVFIGVVYVFHLLGGSFCSTSAKGVLFVFNTIIE